MKKILLNIACIIIVFSVFNSCKKEEKHPELTTTEVTANSASSVIAKAKIGQIGDSRVTDYGFDYYISSSSYDYPSSIQTGTKVSLGKEITSDSFSTQININNNYYSESYKCYVRAYITNEIGTVYANQMSVALPVFSLTGVSPQTAKVGDTVTILGNNFNTTPGFNTVEFNSTSAKITAASRTSLKVIVPSGIYEDYYYNGIRIRVTTGSRTLELSGIFRLSASPLSFSPQSGTWSTYLTIYGAGLNQSTVYLGDKPITSYNSYTEYISLSIPYDLSSKKFKIYISKGGTKTEVPGGYFTMANLVVNSFSPTSILAGSDLLIYGQNFNPSYSKNALFIGSTKLSTNYSSSPLRFSIPNSISQGEYPMFLTNGLDTVALSGNLNVVVPSLSSVSPTSGTAGTAVVINGTGFGNSIYNISVKFGNLSANILSATDTQINAKVPTGISTGTWSIVVSINGNTATNTLSFNVP